MINGGMRETPFLGTPTPVVLELGLVIAAVS